MMIGLVILGSCSGLIAFGVALSLGCTLLQSLLVYSVAGCLTILLLAIRKCRKARAIGKPDPVRAIGLETGK